VLALVLITPMSTARQRTPDEKVIGTIIGHYRVTGVLNQGGMGAVYKAEHLLIGKAAVIKLLLPDLSSHDEMVHRFFYEAKAASAIRHPGIVEIYDFGYHSDGRAYIVMEFLQGESLGERLNTRGRLSERDVAFIGRSVASALDAAHEQQIVHRDLKPENILLIPDPDMPNGERTKVIDFGIAKIGNADPRLVSQTRTGVLMGTPLYMAPEQARGAGDIDHRADLYALGCLMYEMLCGRPPFHADGAGEIVALHLYGEPVPLHQVVPGVTPELEEIVLSLLAKDRDERPKDAREVIERLNVVIPSLREEVAPLAAAAPTVRMRAVVVSSPKPVSAKPRLEIIEDDGDADFELEEEQWFEDGSDDAPSEELRLRRIPSAWGDVPPPSVPPEPRPPGRTGRTIAITGAMLAIGAIGVVGLVEALRDDFVAPSATVAAPMFASFLPTESAPAAAAATAAPRTIALTWTADHADVVVTIDGGTPHAAADGVLTLPRDGAQHTLVAIAPDHSSETVRFVANRDQTIAIGLSNDDAAHAGAEPAKPAPAAAVASAAAPSASTAVPGASTASASAPGARAAITPEPPAPISAPDATAAPISPPPAEAAPISAPEVAPMVAATGAPTTIASTTIAPTTIAPTTVASTTVAPTTIAPATVASTTIASTTTAAAPAPKPAAAAAPPIAKATIAATPRHSSSSHRSITRTPTARAAATRTPTAAASRRPPSRTPQPPRDAVIRDPLDDTPARPPTPPPSRPTSSPNGSPIETDL